MTLFGIVLLRYLVLSVSYIAFVKTWLRKRTIERMTATDATRKQWRKEIGWSALSSMIFAVLSGICFWFYQQGFTKVYVDLKEHSWTYFFFSILVVLFLYETYYYWLHRWMHHPGIFKIVHKVHHESKHPSVFTSFSFHPYESILQFIFLPVIIFIMPVHYYALGIVLTLMTISAIINHAGLEIYPAKFYKHPIGKWMIGSTHHDLHHSEFKSNFGLYFTFWDRWMGTESRQYEKKFMENKVNR
jgi:Delta7-sterol 5-desaturase